MRFGRWFALVLAFWLWCGANSFAAEDPEALKAQIEALKRQMMEMQAKMQAQIEALQKKLEQVQAKGVAPKVVAKEATPVFSKKNIQLLLSGKMRTNYQ